MTRDLPKLVADWRDWSETSERLFDGWEREYPRWFELMDVAGACVLDLSCFEARREDVEFCWAISTECQEMADHASERLREALPALVVLAKSVNYEVRWQV